MPELNATILQQLAQQQAETDAALADDCQALEDILVRLAGPTLTGVEEDSGNLAELQVNLSTATIAQIRRDFLALQRILRRLVAPTDQSIAEDTTLLTGIASRAQGSNFYAFGGSPPDSGMRPITGQMGAGGASRLGGFINPPPGNQGLGLPGLAQALTPGGAAALVSAGQAPNTAFPGTRPPIGSTLTPEALPEKPPPSTIPTAPPALPSLTPTPTFGGGAPTGGSVIPPEPLPGSSPDASALPAQLPPGPSLDTTPAPPLPPLPPAIPAAPQPPAADCNLCDAIRYLVDALRPPLVTIAQSLRLMTPGANARHNRALEQDSSNVLDNIFRWVPVPWQAEIDKEKEGIFDQPEEMQADLDLAEHLRRIGGGELPVPITSR